MSSPARLRTANAKKKKADILYVEIEKWKRAMGMAKKTLVTFSKTSGVDVAHL